jgi:hypothetical protein
VAKLLPIPSEAARILADGAVFLGTPSWPVKWKNRDGFTLIARMEIKRRSALDDAIHKWLKTRQWSGLEGIDSFFIYERVRWAHQTAQLFNQANFTDTNTDTKTTTQLLHWLLFDGWYEIGILRWHAFMETQMNAYWIGRDDSSQNFFSA